MYECTHLSWLAGTYETVHSFNEVQHDIFDTWPDIHEVAGDWYDDNDELVLRHMGGEND